MRMAMSDPCLAASLATLRLGRAKLSPISVRIAPAERGRLAKLHRHVGGTRAALLRLVFAEGLSACAAAAGCDLDGAA